MVLAPYLVWGQDVSDAPFQVKQENIPGTARLYTAGTRYHYTGTWTI